MTNSWNSLVFVLVVSLAICFANNTNNNEGYSQSLQNKKFSNSDNMREKSSSGETSSIGSKTWNGGGGGGSSWGYGWGWGSGSNGGGGGGGGGWCWKGCIGGGGGGGGGGGDGGGNGGGGGGGGGGIGARRHNSPSSKGNRPSYSSSLYRIGEYARCGKGRCRGMKLICPLHCDGPCLYDCESNCRAHCRMLK